MVFDIFFAGVVSMAHCHPGAGRSNGHGIADKLSIEECAQVALQMIEERRKYLPE